MKTVLLVLVLTNGLSAIPLKGFADSFDSASSCQISQQQIDNVIAETIQSRGSINSRYTLSQDEVLEAGRQWLGPRYKQIGRENSGVYVSFDRKRRFRIDDGSIIGKHSYGKPHFHLEILNPTTGVVITNNHVWIR